YLPTLSSGISYRASGNSWNEPYTLCTRVQSNYRQELMHFPTALPRSRLSSSRFPLSYYNRPGQLRYLSCGCRQDSPLHIYSIFLQGFLELFPACEPCKGGWVSRVCRSRESPQGYR